MLFNEYMWMLSNCGKIQFITLVLCISKPYRRLSGTFTKSTVGWKMRESITGEYGSLKNSFCPFLVCWVWWISATSSSSNSDWCVIDDFFYLRMTRLANLEDNRECQQDDVCVEYGEADDSSHLNFVLLMFWRACVNIEKHADNKDTPVS